ncbi:hypothetical protein GOP47_0019575 [Adiantum capillus-veneris]|uniref:Homeobox domain-containing protein n=1 Tax=Adiantum capillus-veneris TaxID=13818 RepID=A0A9D4UBK0_ADICA|nr:hypothetical protein GOP47_0019575 [Adiantum capillus-veneris]
MNGVGGYSFAWSGGHSTEQQGCAHFPASAPGAAAATCNNISSGAAATASASKASWTLPSMSVSDLYDHSSLLECSRCITPGHSMRYGGHGQGNVSILDGDLMQDIHYNMEDEDETLGMEMKIMKKRKLTTEQARQLEASFEADKKLEAEKKQRLAEQLGLQPRQVAVWFQNRRARSKTKQLEIDFLTLKAEFDRVLAQRRALQAEVDRLSAQLQAKSSDAKNNSCSQESTSSTNSNNGDVVSGSTTLQIKMTSPTKDGERFTANFGQDFGKSKEGLSKLQEMSKSPNATSYEWEPYDNGLWVFD